MVNEKNVQEINKIKITGDEIFEKLLNTERDVYRRFEGTIKISSKTNRWKTAHDERIYSKYYFYVRRKSKSLTGGLKIRQHVEVSSQMQFTSAKSKGEELWFHLNS